MTAVSTRDDAVARAERIRAGIRSLAELQQDITDAYHARDWQTLGYDTWESYVAGEFGGAMPRLGRNERRELVVSLRAEGLSTRAIAAAAGTDDRTVRRDLSDAATAAPELDTAEPDDEPTPTPVTGRDGKTYTPKPKSTRPDMLSDDDLAELNDNPRPAAPRPEQKPARKRPAAPRTDVVATVNRVLTRANEAADAADEITAEHLKNRADEAATWSRNLARHVQSLNRLLTLMEGTTDA